MLNIPLKRKTVSKGLKDILSLGTFQGLLQRWCCFCSKSCERWLSRVVAFGHPKLNVRYQAA